MSKTQWILSQLTRQLWFRSSLFAVLAVITALVAIAIKSFIPPTVSGIIGTDAVDKILGILASSMLAVTTFSLNIMVSAYNTASSSVTPRATRLLLEDRTTQNVLATFIGSFLYSLVGIVALGMGAYGRQGRVVLFFVTLMVIVMIVITLLRWIQHLSQFGRMAETSQRVEEATALPLAERLRDPCMGCSPWHGDVEPTTDFPLMPCSVGYLQHVDLRRLSDFAEKHSVWLYLNTRPGVFIHLTCPLLWSQKALSPEQSGELREAFTIGAQRSFDQDPRFGLSVLSEIASRALSPAVNDPGTAIDIIGRAVRLFSQPDGADVVDTPYYRLFIRPAELNDMFDDIFTPIARDGAALVEVHIRLQKALIALARFRPERYESEARRHSEQALERARQALTYKGDFHILEVLAGEFTATGLSNRPE
ncbi:Uncharacterized membrane protein [Candidatus Pantoea symbiotica]|jgi:uncharacterized membrane protein|uniref:Uncharacterized membrane protein n=1 Tax=Candidatus Pantoea symbiotica TaxID=1884370 RepID=A0A1I3YP05_9GAMM|nr:MULTISPECIES: DUF2254 domain-containing protein [Pantoea]SFK33510.1 Uncharacterized membrane protein [Pantoea symbiotica]SFU86617.1 Uncharacterized membrane protein [Pantoea sp. YR525]